MLKGFLNRIKIEILQRKIVRNTCIFTLISCLAKKKERKENTPHKLLNHYLYRDSHCLNNKEELERKVWECEHDR